MKILGISSTKTLLLYGGISIDYSAVGT